MLSLTPSHRAGGSGGCNKKVSTLAVRLQHFLLQIVVLQREAERMVFLSIDKTPSQFVTMTLNRPISQMMYLRLDFFRVFGMDYKNKLKLTQSL